MGPFPPRAPKAPLDPLESPWLPLGPLGSPWVPIGPLGSPWSLGVPALGPKGSRSVEAAKRFLETKVAERI